MDNYRLGRGKAPHRNIKGYVEALTQTVHVACTYIHPFSPNEETFMWMLKRHFHGNLTMLSYIHIQTAYKPLRPRQSSWQSSFLLFTLRVKKVWITFAVIYPMITCKRAACFHQHTKNDSGEKTAVKKHLIIVMLICLHKLCNSS